MCGATSRAARKATLSDATAATAGIHAQGYHHDRETQNATARSVAPGDESDAGRRQWRFAVRRGRSLRAAIRASPCSEW